MKTLLLACWCVLFSLCSSNAAGLKLATVDLQEVLRNYDKAKATLKAIQLQEVSFTQELDGMKLEGQKMMREADSLRESFNDPALSAAERDGRRKLWQEKLQDLSAFGVRLDGFRRQKETELRVSFERSNKKVVDEIVTVTRRIGEKEGFNLILTADKDNPAAGQVIFSRDVPDLTVKVLATLNEVRK